MPKTLSAGYACWNCGDRLAPTYDNGVFKYLVCLDEEHEPVCSNCLPVLRHEEFRVIIQAHDGTVLS